MKWKNIICPICATVGVDHSYKARYIILVSLWAGGICSNQKSRRTQKTCTSAFPYVYTPYYVLITMFPCKCCAVQKSRSHSNSKCFVPTLIPSVFAPTLVSSILSPHRECSPALWLKSRIFQPFWRIWAKKEYTDLGSLVAWLNVFFFRGLVG